MASECCVPYIRSVSAVVDTPWAPHIGLEVKLRGNGEQLISRTLEVAARLPQVTRPIATAVAGSKSSATRLEHLSLVEKKRERIRTERDDLYGEALYSEPRQGQEPGAIDSLPTVSPEVVGD
eukprot:1622249-Pyramimonas_sp.AAC.1